MIFRPTVLLLALHVGVVPAFAQGDGGFQRWPTRERDSAPAPGPASTPRGDSGSGRRERDAQPRTAEPQARGPQQREPQSRAEPQPRSAGPVTRQQPQARQRDDRDDRRAQGGRQDRNRGTVGPRVAVPRQGPPPRTVQRPNRQSPNIYVVRPPAYRYTPRFNRPYVYGSLGPGYFYYGSYGWYPRATFLDDRGYYGRGYGYDVGEVRLRVEPRFAEVYVDGYYAGTVDDFDGTFQSLKLESGPYHIEIVAPGFETLEVDVRVSPGQKITYRGDLRPEF